MKALEAGRMTLWTRRSVLGLVGHRVSLEVSEKVKWGIAQVEGAWTVVLVRVISVAGGPSFAGKVG